MWGAIIATLIATFLFLDAIGVFAILGHYTTQKQQSDLVFSFKSCEKTGNINKNTVLSARWESESLVVTGYAFPNCSARWLFGSYKLDGNKMLLNYSPVEPSSEASACECPRNVRYEIGGLRRADYDISISEGADVEYTPLIAKLFHE